MYAHTHARIRLNFYGRIARVSISTNASID
jgi:hypothetical protein